MKETERTTFVLPNLDSICPLWTTQSSLLMRASNNLGCVGEVAGSLRLAGRQKRMTASRPLHPPLSFLFLPPMPWPVDRIALLRPISAQFALGKIMGHVQLVRWTRHRKTKQAPINRSSLHTSSRGLSVRSAQIHRKRLGPLARPPNDRVRRGQAPGWLATLKICQSSVSHMPLPSRRCTASRRAQTTHVNQIRSFWEENTAPPHLRLL
jgi:hypothetical protein